MDSRRNKEKRRTAKIPTRKRGGEDTSVQVKESRTLKEPDYTETRSVSRNVKKDAPQVKKLFEPVKEQFQMLVQYIEILESRKDMEDMNKVVQLSDFMRMIIRHCEIYLNCKLLKAG